MYIAGGHEEAFSSGDPTAAERHRPSIDRSGDQGQTTGGVHQKGLLFNHSSFTMLCIKSVIT